VQPRCTCGAILPEDARFCHKCGKPQFEEDIARLAEEQPIAPVQLPIGPPLESSTPAVAGITFKNSRAVVISLLVAAGAMVGFPLIALFAAPLFPFFLCAVGFIAVRLYKGRSLEPITTSAGARLGWMTGLWIFVVVAVLLTLTSVVVASPEGWRELRTAWASVPQAARLLSLSQHEFLVQMLITLPFSFFLLTLLPGLGGILGAKFSARKRPS
jgi:hypothetical protein